MALLAAACSRSEEPASKEPAAAAHPHADAPNAPPLRHRFSAEAKAHIEAALAAYETARARLSADTMAGLDESATAMRRAFDEAKAALASAPPEVAKLLEEAASAAAELGRAQDLATARERFSTVSEPLVALLRADERLREGVFLYRCPMVEHFPLWLHAKDAIENPYMGQEMLTCGTKEPWTEADKKPSPSLDEIAYYTCPMHPSVKQEGPGKCPICGMDLTPVTQAELETGVIFVDAARRQKVGVKTGKVKRRPMKVEILATGRVELDETKLVDVSLKLSGWVERLYADELGQEVKKGQTLFLLYSPDLYAAQVEYLEALGAAKKAKAAGVSSSLAEAAKKRLKLWGISDADIQALEERGEAREAIPIRAPASGRIVEKNVVEGSHVALGQRLFRIAPLRTVWVTLDLFENDLGLVKVGQEVRLSLPYSPGQTYTSKISFLYPTLDERTRTGKARVLLENEGLSFLPGMYVNAVIEIDVGERLIVSDEAVLFTGRRRLVFLDLGEGRVMPKEVKVGRKMSGFWEVLEGLEEGDTVVTSGAFLVASESRIRSASTHWTEEEEGGRHGHAH